VSGGADTGGRPPFCASLAEVRDHIDRLDHEIVRLMAERGGFVREAARFKKDTADVAAPARVEQVIAKVRGLAGQAGLPPEVAEAAYRAMITAFIAMERAEFDAAPRG
jgi:isochorismate pyruvate lyase